MAGKPPPGKTTALTIAGFDPSSGAGITADLAVFAAHCIFGTAAITALTVQSTTGVRRVDPVDRMLLIEMLDCLAADLPPAGIKIGMLGGAEQVTAVAQYVQTLCKRTSKPFIVLDPVIRSSSGAELLTPEGLSTLQNELLPWVDVVTPNTEELALVSGGACKTDEEIETACRQLATRYPQLTILATGGHRVKPDDMLLYQDRMTRLSGEWINTRATHGTGCALSSALLCGVLNGLIMPEAAAAAKAYVAQAMHSAVSHGRGNGPLHLLWPIVGQIPS